MTSVLPSFRELDPGELELVALAARAQGAREITHVVAVGNHGRVPQSPCGRDRQVPLDHHPAARVLLPTPDGARSVALSDLPPLSFATP